MCPGAWVIANGGREAMSAACGVTPQAQNTGTSPSANSTGSPKSGAPRSAMPRASGTPTCTGAPCTCCIRAVTCTAAATSSPGPGRIDTTSGPDSRPAGRQARLVRYIDTLRPCSMLRTGTPASSSAVSKLKLQPIRNATRSSVQRSATSAGSTGKLLRLTDTNNDGVADDAGTYLNDSLPGAIVQMRRAGNLLIVNSALA